MKPVLLGMAAAGLMVLAAGALAGTEGGAAAGGDVTATETPAVTKKPVAAKKPKTTKKHAATKKPTVAETPAVTAPQAPAKAPSVAETPVVTKTPAAAAAPPAAAPMAAIAPPAVTEMPLVAKKNTCTTCHAIDKKVIGPAWNEVSRKYKGDASAAARLDNVITKGSKGAWGTMPMPPLSNVSDADRKELVNFILGLAK